MPVKIPFVTWNLKRLEAILATRRVKDGGTNLKFYNGDHWQDAKGWIGPLPSASDSTATTTAQRIQEAFISRNAIAEIVNRHVAGVLGRTLTWNFAPVRPLEDETSIDPTTQEEITTPGTPTPAEQEIIDEAEHVLSEWWDVREISETMQQALAILLTTRRAVLRIYVPPGMRDESGAIPAGDLAASLNRIWLQAVGVNEDTLELEQPSAGVYVDPRTRRQIGIMAYDEPLDESEKPPTERRAEITYLDENDNTVLQILNKDGVIKRADGVEEQATPLALGGRLLMFELTRPPLISPQIVSQQKLLNLAESMKGRNVVLGGFLERILLNAQLPGTIERDKVTGEETFKPKPFQVGAGTTNVLMGLETVDAQGKKSYTTPSVVYRDPVPIDTFQATGESAYLSILQEAQQLHYALAGDAVVSGESRVQARDAFEKDLLLTAGKVQDAVHWVLETALALACVFAGRAGDFEELRAVATANVDSGPISADEMRVAVEIHEKGVWTRRRAMSATGVEDIDAEEDQLAVEEAERQTRAATLATAQLEREAAALDREGNGFRPRAGANVVDDEGGDEDEG